jgi:alpha-tubulin suppressor-like RCC1 family protein
MHMRVRGVLAITALAVVLGSGVQPAASADEPPAVAAAPSSSLFTSVTPVRVLDTRDGTGTGGTTTPVGPASTITLDLSAKLPATATAVVLNITGTSPSATTFIIVHPSGVTRPDTTNLSLVPGETRAALATTAVLPNRKVALYNNLGSTHVIADLTGYYATDTGAKYRTIAPTRMLDTRNGGGPVGPAKVRSVDLSSKVPAGATAVAFNLTGTDPTAWTYITAFPHGVALPSTSNLNLIRAGQTSPNLVVLAIGADRVLDLYNDAGDTHLIVDLVGYYGVDADSVFVPVAPERKLDTRTGLGLAPPATAGPVGPGETAKFETSSPVEDTDVVLFNLTGTGATSTTFVAVREGGGPPTTSALNLVPGQTATNLVMATTTRLVELYNNLGSTHLIGDVAGYFTKTCAGKNGCAYSWGLNTGGQLGDGTQDYARAAAKPVWNTPGITAVAGGVTQNLALRQDGTVLAWGSLVDTPAGGDHSPVKLPTLSGITAIAAGSQTGMALKSDGTVWTWGDGRYGQLGDGVDHGTTLVTTPVRAKDLTGVVAIAAGLYNQYAVRSDGTVWAWGTNSRGQLGNGVACANPQDPAACLSRVPVQVSGLTGVAKVSEDGYALKSDGTVWTWGANIVGLLGTGTASGSYVATVPAQVTALTGITQIDGSNQNRYALKSDGTVWAWGANEQGQIGNGTAGNRLTAPAKVSTPAGVTAIASGEAFNGYAVAAGGTVWSWGDNLNGNLGVPGAGRQSSVPVQVPNLSGVSKVSGFSFGALALVPQPR